MNTIKERMLWLEYSCCTTCLHLCPIAKHESHRAMLEQRPRTMCDTQHPRELISLFVILIPISSLFFFYSNVGRGRSVCACELSQNLNHCLRNFYSMNYC